MKRTVKIKTDIEPNKIIPLMELCSNMFNEYVDWCYDNKTYNKKRAHDELYKQFREKYNINSALVQSVRDTALEAVKRQTRKNKGYNEKHKPRKKKLSGIRYDARAISLRGNLLSLSSLDKRIKTIVNIPEKFKQWKFKSGVVLYKQKTDEIYVNLIFETDTPDKLYGGDILGIDRGLYNLVTTSQGVNYSGSKIRKNQRRYLYNRRKLQAKGTCSAKRRLKAMAGKEMRFSRDTNHCISKQLVNIDNINLFVLEDLKGIRKQRKGKKINKWISSWPFYQFQNFLEYKAEELGKSVVYVKPYYTSQKCSSCSYTDKKNRYKSKFKCIKCGLKMHSDINAAINIRNDYILSTTLKPNSMSVEQVAVNQP